VTGVAIALGSNLGDRALNLREALRRVGEFASVLRVSTFHETEPVGYLEQGRFLNAAALVATDLEPRELLLRLLAVEREMGRARTFRNGPRIIDLDIVLWGARVIDEPGLTVPHPRMHSRAFVLAPLCEIAPDAVHPVLGQTVRQLAARLSGRPD